MYSQLIIFTDGGARGNPGPAAIGIVIKTPAGDVVAAWGKTIGETTNNQAEYKALEAALEKAKELGAKQVDCYLDSLLVVQQVKGEWKVKEATLKPNVERVRKLASHFDKVSYHHVRRELNMEADRLVNEALDGEGRG
jgi:ribonuclease HI